MPLHHVGVFYSLTATPTGTLHDLNARHLLTATPTLLPSAPHQEPESGLKTAFAAAKRTRGNAQGEHDTESMPIRWKKPLLWGLAACSPHTLMAMFGLTVLALVQAH